MYKIAYNRQVALSRHLLMLVLLITAPINGMADSQEYSLFKIELIMAKKGDPDAQFNVGHAYEQGAGIKRDTTQALYWYRKAAAQGHDFAQYSLGLFYEQGLGVTKDLKQAKRWYTLAAKQGNELARQKLLPPPAPARQPAKRVTKPKPAVPQVAAKAPPQKKTKPQPKTAQVQKRPQDIMNIVLRGKWNFNGAPVDYLPSSSTQCLQRGDHEIICFTPELKRLLDNSLITYTAKATIKDFTKEGKFTVDYLYNVTDIRSAQTRGPKTDLHGLQKQEGWQKSRLNLQCSAKQPRRLTCIRDKKRYTFHQMSSK